MSIEFLLFFCICSTVHVKTSSALQSSELHIKYGGEALKSLERLLKFFESDVKDLNLDGLYGLRIAQGQLDTLRDIMINPTKKNIGVTDANNHIQSLSNQIERIANKSLKEIAWKDRSYLKRFALIATKPFVIDYEIRNIREDLLETGERISEFDEDKSDVCFSEILGSNDRSNSSPCIVSQSCWNLMTSSKSTDYRLTHQLLWFLIAKNIGCIDHRATSNLANKNLKYLEDRYCANIYHDAQTNLKNNDNQDLFLEQILLCSMIGYEDFIRLDWLKTILTWQDAESGCFNGASDAIENSIKMKRHLLIEQEMNNGCLSHKSGLASGVLAVYARALLQ